MVILREITDEKKMSNSSTKDPYERWIDETESKNIANVDHLWLVGEFEEPLDAIRRSRMEAYYCGYLGFYEQQSRSEMIDFDILFKWKENGKSVEIYLFPAPVRIKIKGQAAKEVYDKLVIEVNKELLSPYNDENKGGGSNITGNKNYAVTPPPQSFTSGASDPPGTSGPPPPKP